jgi:hypothetical protein
MGGGGEARVGALPGYREGQPRDQGAAAGGDRHTGEPQRAGRASCRGPGEQNLTRNTYPIARQETRTGAPGERYLSKDVERLHP